MVCHLLACAFFIWPLFTICSSDKSTADSAFVTHDFTSDPGPSSSNGWIYDTDEDRENGATCLQNSWRQNYGLEERCKPCDDSSLVEFNNYQLIGQSCDDLWMNAAGGAGSFKPETDSYVLRWILNQICTVFASLTGLEGVVGSARRPPSSGTRPESCTHGVGE